MATIFVDNVGYQVKDGQNLLNACLSLGFNLPYFCWHPAMHSVGACRQCAVKQFRDENDTRGRLVMACMTPASEGTRISIDDPDAKAFRASVIEWLMESHPHDCPVCDEGGECHLQDMTEMTGHVYRRYRFLKRTFNNQYLGPLVNQEMNRCIECYRCVRFYRDYAGCHDFNVFASRNRVFFGRQEDGVLESEFSGNLVEVCPTGVFTDKTLKRHYTRKWDLQTAPSICVHCGVGCNTIPGERYQELRRIRNRFNDQVNGYFLCDRGRYGYEFVNSGFRVRQPMLRTERTTGSPIHAAELSPRTLGFAALPEEEYRAVEPETAVRRVGEIISTGKRVIGVGSPRASLEANFALRTLVGPDSFYLGMAEGESRLVSRIVEILRRGPAEIPSLEDIRRSDAVLILGEDVSNVAPMMALALRQSARQGPMKKVTERLKLPHWDDAAIREAMQNDMGPFFNATVAATRLDEVATRNYRAAPDDIARLGFSVAQAVGGGKPTVEGLPESVLELAKEIAGALKEAERPLVVAGPSLGSESIIRAAGEVARALGAAGRPVGLAFTVPECNSMGLVMMGGRDLEGAFRAVEAGEADTVVVLENDLYRRADVPRVDAFLGAARSVIAIDHLTNATVQRADVVLPAGTFAESDGTLVNNDGRAQRYYQVFVPLGAIRESWRWLQEIGIGVGRPAAEGWSNLDDVVAAMVAELPRFRGVADATPPAGFRIAGQKIAREHQRYTGRTAMTANIDVSEPKPPEDPDAPFVFSMEGFQGEPPPSLIPRFWAPGWNSIQALNKFQEEVGGPLRGGTPGVRLIEPGQEEKNPPSGPVPGAFRARDGEWLLVPLYHVFGSEELSALAPGEAELTPAPYLALNPEDAVGLGWQQEEQIDLPLGGVSRRLELRLEPSLPRGVAGVPVNLPGMQGITLPSWHDLGRGR